MQSSALKYPYQPGFQFRDTSKRAANDARAAKQETIERCLELLRCCSMTADEVAAKLHKSPFYIRPRISELNQFGLINDSGIRRKNASGKSAIVWKAI